MERGLELLIAVLAVQKAGGAFVPIALSYPDHRIALLLEDCRPSLMLVDRGESERFAHFSNSCPIMYLPDAVITKSQDAKSEDHPFDPARLAYILYTSGSSGKPKGVLVEQGGFSDRMVWMQKEFGLTPEMRVLHKTPLTFDVSLWEIFWPLMAGATLVIAKAHGHRDPAYLLEVIAASKIRVVHFVPSMLAVFLTYAHQHSPINVQLLIMCSGEALTPSLVRQVYNLFPNAELVNLYGPTEATIDVTFWRVPRFPLPERVLIGKPLYRNRVYVLDQDGSFVGEGVIGEIHIAGSQVARGYVNSPDQDRQHFRIDPFMGAATERMYRTGDLGKWTADGNIEYLGRIDHLVKINGVRIEPAEVEAVLSSYPLVKESIVMPVHSGERTTSLLALYTTLAEEGQNSVVCHELLLQYLRCFLPETHVPSSFIRVYQIPVDDHGKADRKHLRQLFGPKKSDVSADETHTGSSQILLGLWRDILGSVEISGSDNFFLAGGNSLSAIELAILMTESFKITISTQDIYENPRFEGMLKIVIERRSRQQLD